MKRTIAVFFPSWPDNPYHKTLADNLRDNGVEVTQANGRKAFGRRFFFLPRVKSEWRADVFHIHSTFPFFNTNTIFKSFVWLAYSMLQLLTLRILGVRIVWTVHNLVNQEGRLKSADWLCSLLLGRVSHAVIVHCNLAVDVVRRKYHISNANKIFVVPHGNYIGAYPNEIGRAEARTSLGLTDDQRVLLFIGHIRPYKGVLELIRKAKTRSLPSTTLIVVGKVSDPSLERVIENEIGDTPWIKFIPGYVDDREVQTYMNASDAVVIPYRDIFTSGTIFLAMSFSRPCVAPRMGCIPDTIPPGAGILYDPADDDGLIQAIEEAIRDPERLKEMGKRSHEIARQQDWAAMAKTTSEIYSLANK